MKYELINETTKVGNKTLYRIKALKSFGNVKAGDLGGFVQSEKNLSQDGNAWVGSDAVVYNSALIYSDAAVYSNAQVYGNAKIRGGARVSNNAHIRKATDIVCFSGVGSENGTLTAFRTDDGIGVTRGCFSGTLEEFKETINRTHSGTQFQQEYQFLIDFIELRIGCCA